jgi:nucleotide-binding universal stress UspA family protein
MTGRAQTIVVGFNGSEAARRALDRAVNLVGYGTSLAVVNVESLYAGSNGREVLDEARMRLNSRQLAASTFRRVGEPAAELIEAAKELSADLLVVGEGSNALVSTKLVHEAPCDVLVVR